MIASGPKKEDEAIKALYDSLRDIIKDHKAWSNQVDRNKLFGDSKYIIVDFSASKTDRVPTGIESLMRCLHVGAQTARQQESSKNSLGRPTINIENIDDIYDKENINAEEIVFEIKGFREIAQ